MTESPKRRFVIHLAVEVSILAGIALVTLLLINWRIHDRQIERAHSQVIYSPGCDKALALRLMDEMEARGLFDGLPHLFYLDEISGTLELLVVVAPEALQSVERQQQLAGLFRGICQSVFEQHPVDVWMTDEYFGKHRILIEYRPDRSPTHSE